MNRADGGLPASGAVRAFERLTDGMSACGTLLVLLVMGVMDADVAGRYFFNAPIAGVPEIVTMSLAAIVFLQFTSTLRAGRLIHSDGFAQWVAARSVHAGQWLQCSFALLGMAVFVLLAWALVPVVGKAWATSDIYGVPGVFTFPKWPVLAVVLLGSTTMAIQYGLIALAHARAARLGIALDSDGDPAERILS